MMDFNEREAIKQLFREVLVETGLIACSVTIKPKAKTENDQRSDAAYERMLKRRSK